MKRNGFTMVELIFVIVIIGILAATALPKFSGVNDRARINSELSGMSSLDAAITAAVEFQIEDKNNKNVDWHNETVIENGTLNARHTAGVLYDGINTDGKVLTNIMKKSENYKIVGAVSTNGSDIVNWNSNTNSAQDILFLTGPASNVDSGVTAKSDDTANKPDNNDLWVFNPNSFDLNITSGSGTYVLNAPGGEVIIPAQSIGLLDVNGTAQLATENTTNIRNLTVIRLGTSTPSQSDDVLEIKH